MEKVTGKPEVCEFDCKAGDVSLLTSGHDAWVVGDEPAVVIDFQGMVDYAKPGQ